MSQVLYPGGPTLTLRVAFDSDPLAAVPAWTDITRYLRSWRVGMGRAAELSQFDPGEALFVLSNADRRFDPEHASGPYFGKLLPRKKVNFQLTYGATTVDLFTGYADAWPQEYKKNKESFVNLRATDAFKLFASRKLPTSIYEMVVLADSPTFWYKMHEPAGSARAVDSGTGLGGGPVPGTWVGAPTLGTSAIVPYDGDRTCVTFASAQYLDTGANMNLVSPGASIEGWFRRSTIGANVEYLFETAGAGGLEPTGPLALRMGTDGKLTLTDTVVSVTTASRYDDNAVHHFVANGAFSLGPISLYVDGALIGTSGNTTWLGGNGGTDLVVGNRTHASISAATSFLGSMSHFIITGLTSTQIANHYNAGKTSLLEGIGARIGRVLDYYGWPTADRAIDTGNTTIPAHDLSGQTVLEYLQLLAESENGAFYMLGNGYTNFRQRHANITETVYNTSQATFGDDKTAWAAGTELPYFALSGAGIDETDILNEARITREGGVEQYFADEASSDDYGLSGVTRTGQLMTDDNEARAACEWTVARGKDPRYRVRSITIKPRHPTATAHLWPKVRDLFLEHRTTLKRRPQNVGSVISKENLVQRITHEGSATQRSWTTDYELSPADPEDDWFILDTSALDTGRLAY